MSSNCHSLTVDRVNSFEFREPETAYINIPPRGSKKQTSFGISDSDLYKYESVNEEDVELLQN